MDLPLVTAVMITGDPARTPFAVAAVRSFLQQTYANRQLLIINHGLVSVLQACGEMANNTSKLIVENHRGSPVPETLGQLRNAALDRVYEDCPDSYVIQWDDDDWSHPERIAMQMAVAKKYPGAAVTLWRQVRYSFDMNYGFVAADPPHGIPGTILHPPTTHRYQHVGKHEDSRFLKSFKSIRSTYSAPARLYLRFEHGKNTWDRRHIMGRRGVDPQSRNKLFMTPDNRTYLQQILKDHYAWRS